MISTPTVPQRHERELALSRLIAAPCSIVFSTWTTRLPEWWGPRDMTTPTWEIELRPGGIFRTEMRAPDGSRYPTCGVFLEIVPDSRIVFTDAYAPGWIPASRPFMTGIVTFEALSGRTRVTARALHWSAADREKHMQMGFHQGWGESLDRLAALATAHSSSRP